MAGSAAYINKIKRYFLFVSQFVCSVWKTMCFSANEDLCGCLQRRQTVPLNLDRSMEAQRDKHSSNRLMCE